MSADVDYNALSTVLSSKYRKTVIRELRNGPAIPKELADESGKRLPHISRALQELKRDDLVELLVDEDTQKGRIYGLTPLGEEVAAHLDRRAV